MNTLIRSTAIALPIVLLSGCATTFSDYKYPVQVKSLPREASFRIINRAGNIVHEGITPEVVELEASAGFFKKEKYKIQVWKDNHTTVTSHLHGDIDPWWFGNFFFNLGLGAFFVDSITGSMWELNDDSHTILHQIVQPPLAPQAQAQQPQTINVTIPHRVLNRHVHGHTHTHRTQVQVPAQTQTHTPASRVITTTIPISKRTTTHTTSEVQTVEEAEEPLGPTVITTEEPCYKAAQPCN